MKFCILFSLFAMSALADGNGNLGSLPNGTVGTAYLATLTAPQGNSSTMWFFGGPLPPGLTVNTVVGSTMALQGTPALSGVYSFWFMAITGENVDREQYTVTIYSNSPPPTPPITANNLILNPGLELATKNPNVPDDWNEGGYGTNTAIFSYPVPGQTGVGAKVEITLYTSGDAKWYFDNVTVQPLAVYQFSDAYNTNTTSTLTVQFTASDGTLSYTDLATLPSSNGAWQTAQESINVPPNVVALTVFHLINSVGWIITDNYSLTLTTASAANIFPKGIVSITLDDGWESQYDNALPILQSNQLPATFYIISDAVLDKIGTGYMGVNEILGLQSAGMEIGDHTMDHCDLLTLQANPASALIQPDQAGSACPNTGPLPAASTVQQQIDGAKTALIGFGIKSISTFDYPYGDGAGDPTIEALVQADGLAAARSVNAGYNTRTTDPYNLQTQLVEASVTDFATVKAWIDYAAANKVWLVLTFHQVENDPSLLTSETEGTTTAMFAQVASYLAAQQTAGNLTLATVRDAIAQAQQ